MEIIRNEKTVVEFDTIKVGEVFYDDINTIYMKTVPMCAEIGREFNAVELGRGQWYHFNDSEKVTPVNGAFVIK